MRVALVTLHTSPFEPAGTADAGGMNVHVLELARALVALGHSVTLITREPAGRTVHREPGITVITLDAVSGTALPKERLPELLDTCAAELAELFDPTRTAPESRFDVVHSHYWLSGVAVQQALDLLRTRDAANAALPTHVVSLHTVGAEKLALQTQQNVAVSPESNDRITAERELVSRGTVIAASNGEAQAIRMHYGGTSPRIQPRITVIPPGVDSNLFVPQQKSARRQLIVVGRIQPFKAQDFALDVFTEVVQLFADTDSAHSPARSAADRPSLLFVGSPTPGDEDYLATLKATVTARHLDEQVRFAGVLSREKTARALAESSLTIIPSLSETFGMVALESAATGTPVLAQAVGGLVESVADERSGILMSNRNATAWASRIVDLLTDQNRLDRFSMNAREFALEHSWQQTARRHVEVYEGARGYE